MRKVWYKKDNIKISENNVSLLISMLELSDLSWYIKNSQNAMFDNFMKNKISIQKLDSEIFPTTMFALLFLFFIQWLWFPEVISKTQCQICLIQTLLLYTIDNKYILPTSMLVSVDNFK